MRPAAPTFSDMRTTNATKLFHDHLGKNSRAHINIFLLFLCSELDESLVRIVNQPTVNPEPGAAGSKARRQYVFRY